MYFNVRVVSMSLVCVDGVINTVQEREIGDSNDQLLNVYENGKLELNWNEISLWKSSG